MFKIFQYNFIYKSVICNSKTLLDPSAYGVRMTKKQVLDDVEKGDARSEAGMTSKIQSAIDQ